VGTNVARVDKPLIFSVMLKAPLNSPVVLATVPFPKHVLLSSIVPGMFGLPNMTGGFNARNVFVAEFENYALLTNCTGAFTSTSLSNTSTCIGVNSKGIGASRTEFSADRVSSVYGPGNTNQPESIRSSLLIRY